MDSISTVLLASWYHLSAATHPEINNIHFEHNFDKLISGGKYSEKHALNDANVVNFTAFGTPFQS